MREQRADGLPQLDLPQSVAARLVAIFSIEKVESSDFGQTRQLGASAAPVRAASGRRCP
jgi:hypothetical protein